MSESYNPEMSRLSEPMAYRVAAEIHPQEEDAQGKIEDDIDFEARLRKRVSDLDPDSDAVIKRKSDGATIPEKDLHKILTHEVERVRSSIHFRIDSLVEDFEFEDRLVESGVLTPDTDRSLIEALKKEHRAREVLIDRIKVAAKKPTEENLRSVGAWMNRYEQARIRRKS